MSWAYILETLMAPVSTFVTLPSAFHVVFLSAACLVCVGIYVFRARRPRSLKTLRRFMFPARIFWHRSARLDYKYYLLISMLRSGLLSAMVVSSLLVSAAAVQVLTLAAGPPPEIAAPIWLIAGLGAVLQVFLFDLGYWLGHRAMHEIPLLWEFHKPHHAAEVLTPATAARAHPVEDLIQTNLVAMFLGLGHGLLAYAFGASALPLTLTATNILFFVYFLAIYHLRHSHVWLPVGGWLGYVIQSPAHHQLHHSTAPRHHGKNLGFCLSFWDWLFGTLYMPSESEKIEFGLGAEDANYLTVKDILLRPFQNILARGASAPAKAIIEATREA